MEHAHQLDAANDERNSAEAMTDRMAAEVIEKNHPLVRQAMTAAQGARRQRGHYKTNDHNTEMRAKEATWLLMAVQRAKPNLSVALLLKVAARIAERVND